MHYKNYLGICLDLELRYHCLPHVGVYGDDFDPALPFLLLRFPVSVLNSNASASASTASLPSSLLDAVVSSVKASNLSMDFFYIVHPYVQPQPCQHFECSHSDEINLMLHAWTFAGNVAISSVCYFFRVFQT